MVLGEQKIITTNLTLKEALKKITSGEYVEIILNHKFAVYKGWKKSLYAHLHYDLICDFDDTLVEYIMYEHLAIDQWKIYITSSLFEALILDRENKWYDSHHIYVNKNWKGEVEDGNNEI
jgi:TusA-related sulfurtransferase